MGKGKTYELDQKNAVMGMTADEVVALRPDFSGNSRYSVADVIVLWPGEDDTIRGAFIEMKKRTAESGKRKIVMAGSSDGQNGVGELEELVENTPPWGDAYVVVKFDHRETIVLDAELLLEQLREDTSDDYYTDATDHDVRQTRGGNISMRKPTLDDWQSSTSGEDDHIKLLKEIGVPRHYWSDSEVAGTEVVV